MKNQQPGHLDCPRESTWSTFSRNNNWVISGIFQIGRSRRTSAPSRPHGPPTWPDWLIRFVTHLSILIDSKPVKDISLSYFFIWIEFVIEQISLSIHLSCHFTLSNSSFNTGQVKCITHSYTFSISAPHEAYQQPCRDLTDLVWRPQLRLVHNWFFL